MKKILFAVIATLGLGANIQAQTLPLLGLSGDARSASMGEVRMGEAKGMYIYTNPSSFVIDKEKKAYASASFGKLPDANDKSPKIGFASIGYRLGNNALMLGYRCLSGIPFNQTNSLGVSVKEIQPKDQAFDIAYALSIDEHFSAYAMASVISTYNGYRRNVMAGSLGVYYRNKIKLGQTINYTLGLSLNNLGQDLEYGQDVVYKLPTTTKIGGSASYTFSDNHSLGLYLEGSYLMYPKDMTEFTKAFGLEYNLFKHFSLRTGYHFEDGYDYSSFGFGVNYSDISVDFAYQNLKDNNTLLLTTSFKF